VQRANLEARMGPLANVTVVPNGIDSEKFRPPAQAPGNYPTIVAITRFEKRRGGERLPGIVVGVQGGAGRSVDSDWRRHAVCGR
jgi:glycosyltransferase involved in cell wall biosynthesis